jgi:hypothetical protein
MRITALIVCGLALSTTEKLRAELPAGPGPRPSISAAFSDQTLQLRYLKETRVLQNRSDLGYGLYLTENRAFVASAALMLDTELNLLPHLQFQVGPQVYAALLPKPHNDALAIAVGAQARYDLVPSRGIAIVGDAFYSPSILTFGKARNVYDFSAGAELRFLKRMTGFAGYRWFKFSLNDAPDERLQNEIFVGLRWRLE